MKTKSEFDDKTTSKFESTLKSLKKKLLTQLLFQIDYIPELILVEDLRNVELEEE